MPPLCQIIAGIDEAIEHFKLFTSHSVIWCPSSTLGIEAEYTSLLYYYITHYTSLFIWAKNGRWANAAARIPHLYLPFIPGSRSIEVVPGTSLPEESMGTLEGGGIRYQPGCPWLGNAIPSRILMHPAFLACRFPWHFLLFGLRVSLDDDVR